MPLPGPLYLTSLAPGPCTAPITPSFAALEFVYRDPERGFDRSRVKGVVAKLVRVADPATSTALEVAAGGKLYQVGGGRVVPGQLSCWAGGLCLGSCTWKGVAGVAEAGKRAVSNRAQLACLLLLAALAQRVAGRPSSAGP